jgi:hypothetical protein
MAEHSNDLTKLVAVATDLGLVPKLRTQAIELIGNISTPDALRALLDLAANEKLTKKERELALKQAREIIKSGP